MLPSLVHQRHAASHASLPAQTVPSIAVASAAAAAVFGGASASAGVAASRSSTPSLGSSLRQTQRSMRLRRAEFADMEQSDVPPAWLWHSLWRAESQMRCQLNIAECIVLHKGKLSRWLFTNDEGLVVKHKDAWLRIDRVHEHFLAKARWRKCSERGVALIQYTNGSAKVFAEEQWTAFMRPDGQMHSKVRSSPRHAHFSDAEPRSLQFHDAAPEIECIREYIPPRLDKTAHYRTSLEVRRHQSTHQLLSLLAGWADARRRTRHYHARPALSHQAGTRAAAGTATASATTAAGAAAVAIAAA
jgi:hypothetical protein